VDTPQFHIQVAAEAAILMAVGTVAGSAVAMEGVTGASWPHNCSA